MNKRKILPSTKRENLADVTLFLTISNAVNTFILIVIAMIAVRYLSKQSYGIYLQITFLLYVTGMVLQFGIPRSIYYFIPRVANKKKFVFHTFLIINAMGLVALPIAIFGREKISILLNNSDLLVGLSFLAFYIFLSTNRLIYRSVLLSTNNGKKLALTETIISILFFVSIAIPLFLHLDLQGIFWGLLIYYAFQYMITFHLALKNTEGDFSEIAHSECFAEQLKYILPLGMLSLVDLFAESMDRFIISFFMGTVNFALYDRGALRIPVISGLCVTAGAVIMPKLTEYYKNNEIEKLLDIWHVSIEKVALIVFPCFVFFLIYAKQVITLLYTDSFADSVIIFRIYLFLLLFGITIYGNIFNASNRNTYFLYITIITVLLNTPLGILMVKLYGNMGPAVARVTAYTIQCLISIIAIKYILHIQFKDVFPWKVLLQLMLCSFASGIIPAFLESVLNLRKIFELMIGFPIYFFSFYFIATSFGLIKQEDQDTIFKWTGISWLRKKCPI